MPTSPTGRERRADLVHPKFGDDWIMLLRAIRRFASVSNHLRLASEELASIYDDMAEFFPRSEGGIGMTAGQSMRQVLTIDEIRDEIDEISMRLALDDESQRSEAERGGDGGEGGYLDRKASEEANIEAEEEAKRDKEDWERLVDSQYREQARFKLRMIQANSFSIQRMRQDIDEEIVGGKSLRWWLKMGLI
jgi:hypothetical protein